MAAMYAASALWAAEGDAAETRLRTCLSAVETREALQSQKLVQPFHAMAEVSRELAGESIGIKLCRLAGKMVYEVTVLQHDGRLVYKLVDASSGGAIAAHTGP